MQPSGCFFFAKAMGTSNTSNTILLTSINNDSTFIDGNHKVRVSPPKKIGNLCFLFIGASVLAILINRAEPVMMSTFRHIVENITYEVSHEKYRINSLRTFISVYH